MYQWHVSPGGSQRTQQPTSPEPFTWLGQGFFHVGIPDHCSKYLTAAQAGYALTHITRWDPAWDSLGPCHACLLLACKGARQRLTGNRSACRPSHYTRCRIIMHVGREGQGQGQSSEVQATKRLPNAVRCRGAPLYGALRGKFVTRPENCHSYTADIYVRLSCGQT